MDMLDVCSFLRLDNEQETKIGFIGEGNIWINNTYGEGEIMLARRIIHDAIIRTYPGQLSILGYDADLSGLFAPFSRLSTGENKVIRLIPDMQGFQSEMKNLEQQITAVQNVIQGRANTLTEFRKQINSPVEGYRLIVLVTDLGMVDAETLGRLSLLMRTGPKCGISFLILSTTCISRSLGNGREIELKVSSIAPDITVLEPGSGFVTAAGKKITYRPAGAEEIIAVCAEYMKQVRSMPMPAVPFRDIQDTERIWTEDSTYGITFSAGKYGMENMEITIGDEINQRHNAVITGAVGQGKSNLISVIIHSMCVRYSPDELELYLLDFKEGVTFKVFSDIGHVEFLPHARVLGLECDVSFGLAVMDSLHRTYQTRMRILKDHNVKGIRDLREQYPEERMPRIVVIIDEFQMMFGDEPNEAQMIADDLERSVRLFRAAGIHFILASQALTVNRALAGKADSLFSQVPIRIALKNSKSESQQVLAENNSAAAFLRPREAIVNLDYGEISQNRKMIAAFADEAVLAPVRREMWKKAKDRRKPPYVFESDRRMTVSDAADTLTELRKHVITPMAVIGSRISIDGEKVVLPMGDHAGRNIAVFGSPDRECDQAAGILQSAAVSLALQHPDGNARFLFCDFRYAGEDYGDRFPLFRKLMDCLGFRIEDIPCEMFERKVRGLPEEAKPGEAVYLFAAALDRWEYEKDPYTQASVLKEFAEKGPAVNMHLIGWWNKVSAFSAQIAPFGKSDAFDSRVFLRLDEGSVQTMTSPFVRWNSQRNRALISDRIEFSEEITFIPYSPVTAEDISVIGKIMRQ
ncbi:MAG: hypothetical protein IKI84_13350 [Clostridia bacterium]|nr:hypothetical protein [Clostridia bacterium]